MSLNLAGIRAANDDEQLFNLLTGALNELFPPELQSDRDQFFAALERAPKGLRAMAGIFDLDVSMSLDDLAWHFGNHNDERFLYVTEVSLRELDAPEAADIFLAAWDIAKPFLPEIRSKDWENEDFHDYLEKAGIQSKVDSLNEQMWTTRPSLRLTETLSPLDTYKKTREEGAWLWFPQLFGVRRLDAAFSCATSKYPSATANNLG